MEPISEWLEQGERIEMSFGIDRARLLLMVLFQLLLLVFLSLPLVFAIYSVGIVMAEAPMLLIALIPVLFTVALIANKAVSHLLEPSHVTSVLGMLDVVAATSVCYLTDRHIGQKSLHAHPLIAYGDIESVRQYDGITDKIVEFLFGVRKLQLCTHFNVQLLTIYFPSSQYETVMAHIRTKMQDSRKKQ